MTMPIDSTFPDVMWTLFAGTEGLPLFSANHSTEEAALEMMGHLLVKHPTTSFGICEYRRTDAEKPVTP